MSTMVVARVLAGIAGVALVLWTLWSALVTIVVPRAMPSVLARGFFLALRRVYDGVAGPGRPFATRDRIMATYAPLALVLLAGTWVVLVLAGFTLIFWSLGVTPFSLAFETSGSSLLTLGFVRSDTVGLVAVELLEAMIGLGLVTLVISYLPTIYGAFARREALVGMLEGRAGLPPSPTTLLVRYARIGWLDRIHEDLFRPWEQWFVDIEESHSSSPALAFFRSVHPERSWITAAGCVLDTAALVNAAVDLPHDAQADLMLRSGFLALRRLADFFDIPYEADPRPDDPISVDRDEFDAVCRDLAAGGVPLRPDLDQAWRDLAGWRVNYDGVLVALAGLVMAPPAPWSSDRVRGDRFRAPLRHRRG